MNVSIMLSVCYELIASSHIHAKFHVFGEHTDQKASYEMK